MAVLQTWFKIVLFMALGQGYWIAAWASDQTNVDALLAAVSTHLYSTPEGAVPLLERLETLQSTFTQTQTEKYHLSYASSLGFRGRHEERVALVRSYIGQVHAPERRARFLYELIEGSAALGHYENALQAMNESILLLPLLSNTSEKMTVLQGAFSLMNSFGAYDEALSFADRIYSLRDEKLGSYAACVGLTDKVETQFTRGNSLQAQSFVMDAIAECDANKNQLFTLINKTNVAMDALGSGNYAKGITISLPLLQQFSELSKNSDYVTLLQNALARAYLKTGNTDTAEYYGFEAFQRAQSGNAFDLQEKTSETMAAIKRAQGQLAAALSYYDINLALKKKVLDDQLHKNLAYQRVKFNTQDKANQMALLEQKNKNLSTEKALQQKKYQILILLLTLGAVVLAIVGVWLFNTLRLKNIFRASAQVDGLTQVSNRTHFTVSAQKAFSDPARNVSLVLFDMDFFKKINDTYGHPTGDWVLKTVCDTVKPELHKTALLGRLGGEEFALCLPDCLEEEARALAERCRAAIAAIGAHPSGLVLEISASFGVATRSAHQPDSFEEMLVQADKALYLSKNGGRNRVTVYQHSGTYPT